MKRVNPILKELIAPCGMNCAVCSRYLAFVNNLKRSQCVGCRPGNRACKYLFKECGGPKNSSGGNVRFCFECHKYPCKQIERMDKRYRANYQTSTKENLAFIQKHGVARFVETQYAKHRCRKCLGMISIHNGKCFKCDSITSLVEKRKENRSSNGPKTTS
jgi:hypothetical protein